MRITMCDVILILIYIHIYLYDKRFCKLYVAFIFFTIISFLCIILSYHAPLVNVIIAIINILILSSSSLVEFFIPVNIYLRESLFFRYI